MKRSILIGGIVAILILALVFLVLTISNNNIDSFAVKNSDKTIKIGVLLPLSGSAAYYGDVSQKGIEIAKEEISKKFPDLDIQLYYEDSFYTAKGGVDAYHKLRDINKIDAVITGASQVSIAVQPLSQEDKILQMAIFSSADKYTTPNDLAFRISTRNEVEASKLAEFIKEMDYKRLAIIYLNNDFGVGFRETIKEQLLKINAPTQIISEEAYLLDTTDYRTILTKIKEKNSDSIFMVGTAAHYSLIIKQAKELGINAQFLSMRSAEDPILISNVGESANGLIYTYPFDPNTKTSEVENFVNAFKLKYNKIPEAYSAEGYEGFKLVAFAFVKCGKDYSCVKSYLENLKDYKSIYGNLKFDSNGDVYYEFFPKIVKNGQFVKY